MENNKENSNKIHVEVIVKTEYDIDSVTGVIENLKHTVLKTDDIEFGRQRRSSQPKQQQTKITIDTFASMTGLAIAYLKKSSIKFTKEAALMLGVLNEDGEIYKTPQDKNVRVRIKYVKDSTTKKIYPVMEVLCDDEPDKSPVFANNYTLSCSGRDNEYISNYGYFYVLQKAKSNNEICVLKPYETLEDLVADNNVTLPEGFVFPNDSVIAPKRNESESNGESNDESNSENEQQNEESNSDNNAHKEDESGENEIPDDVKTGIENDDELASVINESLGNQLSDSDDSNIEI